MAYVTGNAADLDAVKTALINACIDNGWSQTVDGDSKTVLYRDDASLTDTIYVQVEVTVDPDDGSRERLSLLGRTSLNSGDSPNTVTIGDINQGGTPVPITFPVSYFVFVFTYEVFLVINYSDTYQWCAFGQSQQEGFSGTGNWVAATSGSKNRDGISITPEVGGNTKSPSGALFWTSQSYNYEDAQNGWLHNDIENTYPWALGLGGNTEDPIGIEYLSELMKAQPNQFSGEGILLPIRAYKQRPESKVSQIAEIENARHIRIDGYSPEQVITLGTDEWMVFPCYKKDSSQRDGVLRGDHSGTLGWAIKKA